MESVGAIAGMHAEDRTARSKKSSHYGVVSSNVRRESGSTSMHEASAHVSNGTLSEFSS
jgi:hypothetical protein